MNCRSSERRLGVGMDSVIMSLRIFSASAQADEMFELYCPYVERVKIKPLIYPYTERKLRLYSYCFA